MADGDNRNQSKRPRSYSTGARPKESGLVDKKYKEALATASKLKQINEANDLVFRSKLLSDKAAAELPVAVHRLYKTVPNTPYTRSPIVTPGSRSPEISRKNSSVNLNRYSETKRTRKTGMSENQNLTYNVNENSAQKNTYTRNRHDSQLSTDGDTGDDREFVFTSSQKKRINALEQDVKAVQDILCDNVEKLRLNRKQSLKELQQVSRKYSQHVVEFRQIPTRHVNQRLLRRTWCRFILIVLILCFIILTIFLIWCYVNKACYCDVYA